MGCDDQGLKCPDLWLEIALGVLVKVSLDAVNI